MTLPLARVPAGTRVRVVSIPDPEVRAQALRLGLHPGAEVTVSYRLRGGPVILGIGDQELALGHALAAAIAVAPCAPGETGGDRP